MDILILYAAVVVLLVISLVKSRRKTMQACLKAFHALERILPQLLVVLALVSVILAVFDSATISRILGEESGFPGVIVAALAGAVTLIPGFVAFPAASELLRNGAGVLQIAAFVSSLMMVGVVTLPMEIRYFGARAAIGRNVLAFLFSFAAAAFVAWVVGL
ncbi:MAG: permease [Spirochaetaceae bacterium]|nr:MAG: permease [Spirochaetaceae bacterium]